MLTSIAAIATFCTSVIGLVYWMSRKSKQKKVEEKAHNEEELAILIANATTDEERKAYSIELNKIRNHS